MHPLNLHSTHEYSSDMDLTVTELILVGGTVAALIIIFSRVIASGKTFYSYCTSLQPGLL